jgi:hypothetical protein
VTAIPAVPVPPFTDFDDAQRFHRLLLLFLRELKKPGEQVGLHAYLLGQAVGWHGPRRPEVCPDCRPGPRRGLCGHGGPKRRPDTVSCGECGLPYPCRTVLAVATVGGFPVPWTPVCLIRAMKAALLLSPDSRPNPSTASFLLLAGDPEIGAEYEQSSGNWIIHAVERGQDRPERLADDAAFIDKLLEFARSYAFPFGWGIPDGWVEAVRPGVAAARARWNRHETLPYLQCHRGEGTP